MIVEGCGNKEEWRRGRWWRLDPTGQHLAQWVERKLRVKTSSFSFFPTIKKKLYFIAKVKIALPATKHLLFLSSSGACVPSFPSPPPLRSWLLSVAYCLVCLGLFFSFCSAHLEAMPFWMLLGDRQQYKPKTAQSYVFSPQNLYPQLASLPVPLRNLS